MNEKNRSSVWVVDDDSSIRWVLVQALRVGGFNVRDFDDGERCLVALKTETPDVLMTDIRMPGISGLELSQQFAHECPDIPCIIMTAHTDMDSALASYETGAFEYLPKPFDLDEVVRLVSRAAESKASTVDPEVPEDSSFSSQAEIIGEAPAMQEVFRAIGRLAKSNINVMVCGQSGTGKELVAKALHRHSPRSKRPFIAINIAAIPAELIESELFGHEKGAFTGAQSQRKGRFEQANQGTLFLDEIGEMSADLQTRLLRVLSDRRFYRVGGHELVTIDVRVLAATNRDLEEQVKAGKFREDLYHRLNVIRIDLPSLRERIEDIPLLAQHFLGASACELDVECKQLATRAMLALQGYDWPGNVRELENVCRWITVMAPSQSVSVEELPKEIIRDVAVTVEKNDWRSELARVAERMMRKGQNNVLPELQQQFEHVLIGKALTYSQGHRQHAAKILGWGRNTLTRKLKKFPKIELSE